MDRRSLVTRYEAYLETCNRHALDELAPFLADRVTVNGRERSRAEYIDDLRELLASFPDYRWRIRRVIVEDSWLAVHLVDTGTRSGSFLGAPADGAVVTTDEFAMYRFDAQGRIEHVEVAADDSRLMRPAGAGPEQEG